MVHQMMHLIQPFLPKNKFNLETLSMMHLVQPFLPKKINLNTISLSLAKQQGLLWVMSL